MQNSQIIKAGFFVVLFLTVMLLPVHTFSAAQKTSNWLDEPVTIRFQDEPLGKVLEKVSKQTGIAILYDQELANDKVSGNYKDVKASDAINRLFSEKNKSIQVSKDKKVIIVKTFGAKNFIWASKNISQDGSQMTITELDNLHAQQYKEYKERLANDNEVLVGGMTRGEIRAMHEEQDKEYQAQLANDNEVLVGGKTRGEIRAMHEQQDKEYQAQLANDNEVLVGGKTRVEIRAMHEEEDKEYQAQLANDNEVLVGGMTRGEIRAMHEQQDKEFRSSIKALQKK